ncbi:MAG: SDR family oxidoreductase [Christensenellales bacterium]|nr:SDR family oxidoreductase [Christensenellales bacterium]
MKTAVLTGGANGIGRCTVEALIREGYYVYTIDLDAERLRSLVDCYPDRISVHVGDVASQADLDAFLGKINAKAVDVLINNACFGHGGLFSCDYAGFSHGLAMGVTAPFYLTQQLLPLFRPGASVINIASTRSFMSQPDTESYTAAKGGISALTHALCVSLSGRIRVNAISPGWIETSPWHAGAPAPDPSEADRKQHPAGRIGTPEDIVHAILFLISEEASFIDGQNLIIDGGMTRQMIYHNDYGWTLSADRPG